MMMLKKKWSPNDVSIHSIFCALMTICVHIFLGASVKELFACRVADQKEETDRNSFFSPQFPTKPKESHSPDAIWSIDSLGFRSLIRPLRNFDSAVLSAYNYNEKIFQVLITEYGDGLEQRSPASEIIVSLLSIPEPSRQNVTQTKTCMDQVPGRYHAG